MSTNPLDLSPRIRELFEAALNIEPAERAAWLDNRCTDAMDRLAVERLLTADNVQSNAVVDHAFSDLLGHIGETDSAVPSAGTQIGVFTLHEQLGEGGSSIVFKASREQEGVTQVVALKLLRRNLYTEDERRSFRDERRALSQLQHPGIARLIEGGLTEAGTPYIALDLVEGESIIDHARSHTLDLSQRLRLFVDVCRAVEAAHRALIVHRDLKPSNVMVTTSGEVKLLDFGIAKLLDNGSETDATQTQHAAMTPAYAAPEQFARGQITTATDVYSLGVLLGELITGHRHETGDSRTPSAQVTDIAAAQAHLTSARVMRKRLRGDLDNIVLKATAEEPENRYASAGAFADDIARHLHGEPVFAHPPSRLYRARKFVGRHRGGVITTVAFLLAIIAALGVALWQGREARHAAQRANAMRDFMVSAFAEAEPSVPREGPPRITEVVSEAISKARADPQMNLEVRTELLSRLGNVLVGQGDLDKARETLEWNYAEALSSFGIDSSLTIDAGRELVAVMILNGDFPPARILIDKLLEHVPKSDALARAKLYFDSARLGTKTHELKRALSDAAEGLRLARGIGSNEAILPALDDYGNVQLSANDAEGAIATFGEALDLRKRRFGPVHLHVANSEAALSRAYRRHGDVAAAEQHIRTALAVDTQILPKDDWRHANHLNALMMIQYGNRDFRRALENANEGLRINRIANGDNHPETANDLNSVGMLNLQLGNYKDALHPLRESLMLSVANQGPQNFDTAVAHANYGVALGGVGRFKEGEAEIEKGLA
ncbi:MAG: protein kinase, partial [Dokdonella sp.]